MSAAARRTASAQDCVCRTAAAAPPGSPGAAGWWVGWWGPGEPAGCPATSPAWSPAGRCASPCPHRARSGPILARTWCSGSASARPRQGGTWPSRRSGGRDRKERRKERARVRRGRGERSHWAMSVWVHWVMSTRGRVFTKSSLTDKCLKGTYLFYSHYKI